MGVVAPGKKKLYIAMSLSYLCAWVVIVYIYSTNSIKMQEFAKLRRLFSFVMHRTLSSHLVCLPVVIYLATAVNRQ